MSEYHYPTQNINNSTHSSKYEISNLQAEGTIICISDPSGADIYVDGVFWNAKTSVPIIVETGNRDITFIKAGYEPYTEKVAGLKEQQITKVAAILGPIANITNSGIVICATTNIASCPMTPIICPTTINPLDYINFIAIINSIIPKTVTVRFTYTLDDTTYHDDITVNLLIGNNVIYAWATNRRCDVNMIIMLIDVSIVSQVE